jgi:quercetin dioxygenase-like cupin family protein
MVGGAIVRRMLGAVLGLGMALCGASSAAAQVRDVGVPGECVEPAAGRAHERGCYLTATADVGSLPRGPVYWHLYTYPTRVAAEADSAARSTVVESLGRVWRFTIAGRGWRPAGGTPVAVVGPLLVDHSRRYTARYLEAVSRAGMHSQIHRHPGPEAWYMLEGAQCLEVPGRTIVARAGHSAVIPGGPPMQLSTVGTATRRAVVLVLHDASRPWVAMEHDWKPAGLCDRVR